MQQQSVIKHIEYGGIMADNPTIYIINGPNLNMLGVREPEIYGHETLDDVAGKLEDKAKDLGLDIDMRQSNHEGHLIDWVQEAYANSAKAIILNAGALTHTSMALYDAIRAVETPVIEVHISNPAAREHYRTKSWISKAAIGTISGFGTQSYILALDAADNL